MYVAVNKAPDHPLLFDGKRREHLPYLLGKRIAYHAGEEIVRIAIESLADEHKAVELRIAPAILYIGYLIIRDSYKLRQLGLFHSEQFSALHYPRPDNVILLFIIHFHHPWKMLPFAAFNLNKLPFTSTIIFVIHCYFMPLLNNIMDLCSFDAKICSIVCYIEFYY